MFWFHQSPFILSFHEVELIERGLWAGRVGEPSLKLKSLFKKF